MDELERMTPNDYRCEVVAYELTDSHRCELCGTLIKHQYTIRDEHGKLWRVGSECAAHYGLGVAADDITRLSRKAMAEWRTRPVKLNVAETREQFVTRRVQEMRGDRRVFEAWLAFNSGRLTPAEYIDVAKWHTFKGES